MSVDFLCDKFFVGCARTVCLACTGVVLCPQHLGFVLLEGRWSVCKLCYDRYLEMKAVFSNWRIFRYRILAMWVR